MKKTAPSEACRFGAQLEVVSNGDGTRSKKIRMLARSAEPINHWHFGTVIHDMDGLELNRSRLAVDYAHNDQEVIGYLSHFETDHEGLHAAGALIPYADGDRASEVIHKLDAGVPYEASINFNGPFTAENVPKGKTVEVNGRKFSGPGVVIRNWVLRGVAVCPYGADQNTSTLAFSGGEEVTYEEIEMTTENTTAAEVNETVDAETVNDTAETQEDVVEAEAAVLAEGEAAPVEAAPVDAEPVAAGSTELSDRAAEGKKFISAFGERGALWFAEGLTFEDAQIRALQELRKENEELRQQLTQTQGGAAPAEFSAAPNEEKSAKVGNLKKQGMSDDRAQRVAAWADRV